MATVTAKDVKIKQGLVLTCTQCLVKNYLDPYPFWNFAGNTKCGGCDQIYAVKFVNGQLTSGPTAGSGKVDLLPGYCEKPDGTGITGDKVRAAPQARPDPFTGQQKKITTSVRGKPVSGSPVKKEDLVGSRARFIVELNKI